MYYVIGIPLHLLFGQDKHSQSMLITFNLGIFFVRVPMLILFSAFNHTKMTIKEILLAIELKNVFSSPSIKSLSCSTSSVNSLYIFPLFNLPANNRKQTGIEGCEADKRQLVSAI